MPDECYHLAEGSFVSDSFDEEFSTLQANINGTHYLLAVLKSLAPGAASTLPAPTKCSGTPTRCRGTNPPGFSRAPLMESAKWQDSVRPATIGRCTTCTPATGFFSTTNSRGGDSSSARAPEPGDYVIATGETHGVREFTEVAFAHAGLDYRERVVTDPKLCRPSEIDVLVGDASKARRVLGWTHKTRFRELVQEMLVHDCRALGTGEEALKAAVCWRSLRRAA